MVIIYPQIGVILDKTNLNPYDGTIEEVQIYSGSSATLTADVNDRLSLL